MGLQEDHNARMARFPAEIRSAHVHVRRRCRRMVLVPRMRYSGPLLTALSVIAWSSDGCAHMPNGPRNDWSLGGSAAYALHPSVGNGFMYGLDFAYMPTIPVWLGGGVRAFENLHGSDRIFYPYVEAGAWLVLNVGGGYSLGTGGPNGASGFHLFLGLPFLLPTSSFYIEPYYRVLFATSDALHEVGLLLKWTSWNGD
jgi:hypothetical protein